MRSDRNKPRHIAKKDSKDKISDIKESVKKSAEKAGERGSKLDKTTVLIGAGLVFFLITAVISVNFAVNSKADTSVDVYYEALDSDLIYNGVYLEEVNIGGLTKEQAIKKGNTDYAGLRQARSFTLMYGRYAKDVTYGELGAEYDIKSAVNDAYKIGRSGSKLERVAFAKNLEDTREYLVPLPSVNKGKMKETLESIAEEVNGNIITDGEMDIDRLMEMFEEYIMTNQSDMNIYIPVKQ